MVGEDAEPPSQIRRSSSSPTVVTWSRTRECRRQGRPDRLFPASGRGTRRRRPRESGLELLLPFLESVGRKDGALFRPGSAAADWSIHASCARTRRTKAAASASFAAAPAYPTASQSTADIVTAVRLIFIGSLFGNDTRQTYEISFTLQPS